MSDGELPPHLTDIYKRAADRAKEPTFHTDPDTGARKEVKLARFDLVPARPLWLLAEHYGIGARKYDTNNWRQGGGYAWSLSYTAAMRHLLQFWAGENIDEETGSLHVIAAAWHCFSLAEFLETNTSKDDRWPPMRLIEGRQP